MSDKRLLLQVQRKVNGPWTEVAAGANVGAVGGAMLRAKACRAYRVLEIVEDTTLPDPVDPPAPTK